MTAREQLAYLTQRYASQRRLAQALGISQTLVSMLVAGKRLMTDAQAQKIEKLYAESV
jgi:plasmid maintenance system antidote protein VapI